MQGKLYHLIAQITDAYQRCIETNNDWSQKHAQTLETLQTLLPSGSGFDSGTKIDLDRSTGEKLVLHTSYHHMHESGMYDGWTDHTVTVRASLIHTIDLKISGPNRNEIKDYIHETFHHVLTTVCGLEWFEEKQKTVARYLPEAQ